MKASLATFILLLSHVSMSQAQAELFPKNNAVDVNPDTRLKLTFSSPPPLGNTGKIRIYDASNDSVADELDLSIPPGPRNTRTPAPYDTLHYSSVPDTVFTVKSPDTDTSHVYQQNYIAGTADADAHHFFPVLIDANVATIAPHNNKLAYNKTYYVQIDAAAFPFADNSFTGISGKTAWTFTTKKAPAAASASTWVVSADGSGDFNTVQGAIDAVPDNSSTAKEIFIKNGNYDEIVVLRNKQNLTLHGEDRTKVSVRYANNGVFNASGRSEFSVSNSTAVNLINFTIQSVGKDENPAQAEALYVKGDKLQVHDVTMLGSGDAVQIQLRTRLYVSRSSVRGYGDNLLSYGAAFFKNCDFVSTYGPHGWPRNPNTNHGDVFLNSTFSLDGVAAPPAGTGALGTSGDGHCDLARSPSSGTSFPYAEFVLISCKLADISPAGWGAAGPDYSNVHFWEYNSVNLSDGMPVDVSQRVSYSRQLTMAQDADTIANYSDPSYVLAGWTPELAPVILTQLPDTLNIPVGGSAELSTSVAAEPAATFQWSKDGQALTGQTDSSLKLDAATPGVSGVYTVSIQNSVGKVSSNPVTVVVGPSGMLPAAGSAGTVGVGAAGTAPPAAGAGAQAGSVAVQAGGSSAVATAGTAAPQAGATGTMNGSGMTTPTPNTQTAPRSHGGCSVGAARADGEAWLVALAALLTLLGARRRRRVC